MDKQQNKTRAEQSRSMPQIRFPEFKEDWNVRKLEEIGERVSTKNTDFKVKKVLTNSAVNGIVSQEDFFDKKIANNINLNNYYIADVDDFVYNPRISNHAPVGPFKRNNLEKGVLSPLYTVIRINEGDLTFFEYYFETTYWFKYLRSIANYGARHDRMNITNDNFIKLPIPFPTLAEQQKIAHFFSIIDKKINQLQEKKTALELYKKGMMQQIFSQELRFKDENGKNFPKWEVKKLGEVGETFNGLSGKTKEDFGTGKLYIQYKQVFDDSKINISNFGLVNILGNEKQNVAQFGDVFFTVSSETPLEIGMSSVLLEKVNELYLNSFCFGFRPNSLNELNPYFLRYLFRSEYTRKKIVKLAQGSTRYNMSKVQFVKIKILLPTLAEQEKIANFLSKIDDKINTVTEQIEQTKEYKKGMLQKMFV